MKENRMTEIKDTKKTKPATSKTKKKDPPQNVKSQKNKESKDSPKSKPDNNQGHKQDQAEEQEPKKKRQSSFDDFGNQVEKIAVKTAESIRKVVDKALASRNTVLTIRVNDESNRKMNMLVDAGLFRSRSESAAFLIQEGIKNQDTLFNKISDRLEKIEKIRDELKRVVSDEFQTEKTDKQ
jgi:hypothetical protein